MLAKKRLICIVLSLMLLIGFLPTATFAAPATDETEQSISIGDVQVNYTATSTGSYTEIGQYTSTDEWTGTTTAPVYLVSLPYGSTLTGFTGASSIGMYGTAAEAVYFAPGTSETLLDETAYFTGTEFLNPPAGSAYAAEQWGAPSLQQCIAFTSGYTLPTSDVEGFVCTVYDSSYQMACCLFIQISTSKPQEPTEPTATAQTPLTIGDIQVNYTATSTGSYTEIGQYTSTDGWTGTTTAPVYLVSLPYGTTLTGFTGASSIAMYGTAAEAVYFAPETSETLLDETAYFTGTEFLNPPAGSAYAAEQWGAPSLQQCIAFTSGYTLPTSDVKGFVCTVYDSSYQMACCLFIQIGTAKPQEQTEPTATAQTPLTIGDIQVNYTATSTGSYTEIGQYTSTDEWTGTTTAPVYLVSLPYGTTLTGFTGASSIAMYGTAADAVYFAPGTSETLLDETAYFTGTEFLNPPTGSAYSAEQWGAPSLQQCIAFTSGYTLPTSDVKGFVCTVYDSSYQMACCLFIQISTVFTADTSLKRTLFIDDVVITYTATSDGSVQKIGQYKNTDLSYGDLYLVSLPCGATVTEVSDILMLYMFGVNTDLARYMPSNQSYATLLSEDNFLINKEFQTAPDGSQYGRVISGIEYNEGYTLPTSNVKGYLCRIFENTSSALNWVFIQISTDGEENAAIDRTDLDKEIAIVWNGENYTGFSYQEYDRYNGKRAISENPDEPTWGFWHELIKENGPLEVAKGDFISQERVDATLAKLRESIDNLIPSDQANATLLYEALQKHWIWDGSHVKEFWGNTNYEDISASNTTSVSWQPYAATLSEGQTLLASLFDENGNATPANKASLNTRIAELVDALDVSKLVNKVFYTEWFNNFQTRRSAAEALLAQADPSDMDSTAYTSDSWGALETAWGKLNDDLNHRIEGGSSADMEMLLAFPAHYDALQTAYQALVSDTDITVNFTYVNNFAAKYPALRSSGQDILQMASLPLAKGHTTVQDTVTAAYVQFDSCNLGITIPGEIYNTSDTSPVYLVYVKGKYMGNSTQTIQLHDQDDVLVVRICEPVYVTEVSTGQSSSSNLENPTLDTTYLGDSFATIAMTAPDAPKVGDKAAFSATLTGAYGSNVGDAWNAGNITLFVSEPYTDEMEHFTHQPTTNTGVSTDASGKLEYVFSEPGWYAVAMFNVEDDTPTFTDIFGSTTEGAYPSVYAGDFTFVYVAPSEDEAKLIAQYKAEYAETAKAYFDGFHDYDFADGFYAETFKPQYDALVEHLDDAISYKALKEQFEADFALLKEYGATAIDHQGLVDALREKLSYLPEDITALNSSHAAQVTDIQTAYAAMGTHTKTLLTQAELDRLDRIAAIDVSALPAVAAVTVQIQTVGTLPSKSGNGNPYYGYPNLTWVKTPNLDGTVDYPVWATTGDSVGLSAKAGDHVFVRRYLNSTDAQYRLFWSVDDGTTWTSSLPQTLVTPDGVAYDGYYLVEYVVPQDVANGSTVTIQLKMWSKAEYDANGIESTKADALAALHAAYDAYDLTQYDDAGKAALAQALEEGKAAVSEASTIDGVATARKAAIAAMAAVPVADGKQTNSSYDSGATVGRVFVTIENKTWTDLMYGTIAEGWYELGEKDSMMTVILKVLEDEGYTWSGTGGGSGEKDYSITYLAGITKDGQTLAEFTGGKKSGWMGTLNDWFTNEGFQMFSVANGKLENNDVIRVMYTTEKGTDIGSVWGVNDTSLATLTVSAGTLSPAFDGGTTDYTLVLPEGVSSVTVKPVPVNKNYQSRIFLNSYNQDSAMFKRTDAIPVKVGDVIYVGVGEQGWPTMNSGGKPTKYTIRVATADGAVDDLDTSKVNLQNYKTYAAKLASIDRDSLTDAGKARYDAVQARIDFYQATDDLKAEIKALPGSVTAADKTAVDAAMEHYNALTEAHDLLTGAETNKLFKADNTIQLLAAMDKVAATKDFDHTEANTSGEVKTALESWLNGLGLGSGVTVAVTVDDCTAATASADGSYSATVTLSIGEGGRMASAEKIVTGEIHYIKSNDAGVKSITANGVNATGSGTAWSAVLPYGSNVATATVVVEPADGASASVPATADGGATWTFTVTAEDGTTEQNYTLTLSVNDVITTAAQSSAYIVGNDAEPITVTGLIEAVSTDALDLPVGASTVSVWLEVSKTAQDGDDVTVNVAAKYSVDGGEAQDIPDAALIGDATVTLPIAGTANARVLHGDEYLTATGSASGITFVARSGQYTLIPDALIASVTYHLNGGTATGLTDGQQIAYYRGDALTIPEAERSGYTLKGWYASADGSGSPVTAISAGMPGELWAIWQSSDASATVKVGGIDTTLSGTVFTISLPFGSAYPAATDITITPAEGATASAPVTEDEGASWSFKVTAEDGTEKNYTLQVEIAEQTAAETLTAAKAAIEAADWTVAQATANDATALKTFVEGKLAEMDLNVSYEVTVSGAVPAAAGTKNNENGTDGSYGFTAALTLGEESATATVSNAKITATAYVAPQIPAYTTALNAVLPYIKSTTPNPNVGSNNGEWVVFALNRGGVNDADWNNKYLANLQTYVDNRDGKLHDKKYTEYSRVVLALTAMGVDATKFQTATKTYDLVTPLLDKQDNGAYWAEWQGNNGTAFALLALNSHNYLANAEGNAARAAFIASLKANQLTNGSWPISDDATSDYDVTAAAIYALAPYYLDSAKLAALGGSVSYAELKSMVDKALTFLSGAQGSDGGFGSPEADGWVIIALSALNRDAATNEAFIKNGISVLEDMLGYYDAATGGFKHAKNDSVNQMSSEQAAYDLVAYDRFKKGQNTLYDMSDVTLKQNEVVSGGGSGSGEGGGGGTTPTGNTITVTMRLIGAEKSTKDVDLGAEAYLPDYVTWIPTTPYTLEKGATVYDLWTAATADAGIRSVGAENNYVETVYAPEGYALSEFTNGKRSGWMYTINGSHPGYGLKEQGLEDGDIVIWHYINDYSYECADWFGGDDRWPSLGDGTYYSFWLKAPDTYLGKGGGIGSTSGGSSGGGSSTSGGSGSESSGDVAPAEVTVKPEVTDGEAKAEVTEDTVAEALKNAENSPVLTVNVNTQDADSVELALGADAVKAAADSDVDLHVETEVGTIKVDSDTLGELAESGKDIVVTVTANENGTTTLDVTADGESIDAKVKVELPATEDNQVLVIVNEDGTETVVKKSLVEDGKAYAELPAGATVKVVEAEGTEFGDVADSAWYADAVEFVASHELFQGTNNGFEPETTMNRAMLVTVLYRLEDAKAEGGSTFGDVDPASWYAEAVAWADETGIVKGTDNGFEPNAPVTREQIATILYRYANVIGLDTSTKSSLSGFPDGGETSSWASDAMQWAVSVGLFQGDGHGALNPTGEATRAQVATLFERMIGLIVK